MFFNIAASFQDILQLKTNFESIGLIEKDFHYLKKQVDLSNKKALGLWTKISINNLSFSYENSQRKSVLSNISLQLLSSSKIVIIGKSGSGKSTLLSILSGLYKAKVEEIVIDDQHYTDLSILSTTATLVLQDPEIFEGTIYYNVAVGTKVEKTEIKDFLKTACFEDVIHSLPKGLYTDIREKGVNLSGGEKQRLALARGLLSAKDSSIILLDEPTSSVDIHNEDIIYENIFSKFKDKCIISSVYRLYLLDKFDLIYVWQMEK